MCRKETVHLTKGQRSMHGGRLPFELHLGSNSARCHCRKTMADLPTPICTEPLSFVCRPKTFSLRTDTFRQNGHNGACKGQANMNTWAAASNGLCSRKRNLLHLCCGAACFLAFCHLHVCASIEVVGTEGGGWKMHGGRHGVSSTWATAARCRSAARRRRSRRCCSSTSAWMSGGKAAMNSGSMPSISSGGCSGCEGGAD